MNYLIAVLLIVSGVLIVIYGDKTIQKGGGAVLKTFLMPRLNIIVLKWAIGLLCIWAGLSFLFGEVRL